MSNEQKIRSIREFLNTPPPDMYLSQQAIALKKICLDILLEDIDDKNKFNKIHDVIVSTLPILNLPERFMTWFEGIKAFCSAVLQGEFKQSIPMAKKAVQDKKTQMLHFHATFFSIVSEKMFVIGAEKNNKSDCARFDPYCAKNNLEWFGNKGYFKSSLSSVTQKIFKSAEEFVAEKEKFIDRILENVTLDFNTYLENELPKDQHVDILMVDRCVMNYFEPNFQDLLLSDRITYSLPLKTLVYELIPELNKKVMSKFIEACMARLNNNATLIVQTDESIEIDAFFDSFRPLNDPLLLGNNPGITFDGMREYTGFKPYEFELAHDNISSLNLIYSPGQMT